MNHLKIVERNKIKPKNKERCTLYIKKELVAVIDYLIKMFSYLNKKLDDVIDLLGFGYCSLQLAVGSSAID